MTPVWRRRRHTDLDEEIAAHFRIAVADRVARGESPEDAERAVRREFGNVTLIKETTRDIWGWRPLSDLWQDITYAGRTLGKARGFTAVVVLTLALGIGANSAMFSIINAVLLRPLAFPDADRLVSLSGADLRRTSGQTTGVSWPDFFDWRTRTTTLAGVSAYRGTDFTVGSGATGQHLAGAVVSADFFSTLGVAPHIGRPFTRDDERPGADVVIVSDGLWRSQFGNDARTTAAHSLVVNGRRLSVIGVMPDGFRFPVTFPAPQLWVSAAEDSRVEEAGEDALTTQRGARFLRVVGRLGPSVSLPAAQREFDTIAAALAQEHPDSNTRRGIAVASVLDVLVGDTRRPLMLLLAAVGCLLLVACVNIANLLLVRGAARRREISLRAALGASRFRIVRQLVTESLSLSAAGAACGLALAYWTVPVLVRLAPVNVRGLDEVTIDGVVIAFTTVLTAVSVVVFGLVHGLQASRIDLSTALQAAARSGTGRTQRRLRIGLVIAETAIGVVLLVGAGLFLRGFDRLLSSHPGFDPNGLVAAQVDLPDGTYPYLRRVAFFDRVLTTLRETPGIEVAAAGPLPLSGTRYYIGFALPGAPVPRSQRPSALFMMTSPGYFHAMRIPLLRGRDFLASDNDAATRVAIVSDAFARRYFPGQNPIGQRIQPGITTTESEEPWREIVGVVADVKNETLNEQTQPAYYIPYAQGLIASLQFVIRSSADPTAAIGTVRAAVQRDDAALTLYNVRSVDEFIADSVSASRFQTSLLGAFAALALLLAAVGLYGLTSYGVAQRRREFGVRLAVGARPAELIALVLREGIGVAGIGLALGIIGAASVTRLLTSELNGIAPLDPLTFGAVSLTLFVVAVVACLVPALRTTHIDPVATLRHD
jgi:putative ABC transport system permease protein